MVLRNCNHGTQFFDVAFDIFLTFLRIWEFSSCRPRKSLQNLSNDNPDDNLSPNVSMGKRQAPRCGLSLACVRQQCHWRSEYAEFCLMSKNLLLSLIQRSKSTSHVTKRHCRRCTSFLRYASPSPTRYSSLFVGT